MKTYVSILHADWRQGENETGEIYDEYTVGENTGIVEIEEFKPQGSGDAWNYLVTYKNGIVRRVFNPNYVEYGKSRACSEVLKLMDQDYTYSDALKAVLEKYKSVNKIDLEFELDKYI